MKRLTSLILAFVLISTCAFFTSCGDENDVVTDVKFTAYDNGEGDMISFYMTSDIDVFGVWEYSLENGEIFTNFFESENTEDYGLFDMEGTASYKTLVLKPVSEGEAKISFYLTDGEMKYNFSLKVTKEKDKFQIKAEEIKG